jgi:hypothetical protein
LIDRNVEISPEVTCTNGYSREILERDGDSPLDVYRDLESYVGALPICSYNLRYDLDEILISDWSQIGIAPIGSRGFCVWELAQRLFDPSSAGDCSLQTLRQFYQLPEYQAPAALAEVLTVIDLLEQVLLPLARSRGLDSWADIARFLQNPWYPRCWVLLPPTWVPMGSSA